MDDLPEGITDLSNSMQAFRSDAERQQVKDLATSHKANLSTIRSRINCIDDQIARLRSHCQQLRFKRDQEIKHIKVLKSILSPFRRVPTDVLCEIFERCLPEMSTGGKMNVLSNFDAPLLLCHVCSEWRRTALGFPPLWKSVALVANCWYDLETKVAMSVRPSVARILASRLPRAGSGPLSLSLDLRHQGPSNLTSMSTVKLKDVFTRLPHSRLEHLSLRTEYPSDTYFLAAISQKFTQLQSIFLQTRSGHNGDLVSPPDRLLQLAPRLRSAELHNFIRPTTFPRNLIPWSQLTHLRIEAKIGETIWYTLICLCTNLQHGIFSLNDAGGPVIPVSDHEIVLSHLVDLTLHVPKGANTPRFRRLVFRKLRRLQWLFDEPLGRLTDDHIGDSYLPSIERDSLKTLVIAGVRALSPPQLISLFSSASSITDLHLSVVTDYSYLLNILASSSSHKLLPNLDVLHCDIIIILNVDTFLENLASFVRSRWWDVPDSPATRTIVRLRRLTLNFEVTEEMWDLRDRVSRVLQPFTERGLSFALDVCPDLRHRLNLRKMMTYEMV